MEFHTSVDDVWDGFYLMDMELDKNATHIYKVNNWEDLSSGKPVTLSIDEESDGLIDRSVTLETGLTGEDVDALLLKSPMIEPAFSFLLFFIVGSILVISIGSFFTEIGKWTLLMLFLPLYSRIKKEELLNQPIRYKIHGYLIGNPGAHFGLIKQDLGIPNGQLAYHLRQMMKAQLIYSKEDGIRKRFYPADIPKSKGGEHYFSDIQEKILGVVKRNSGISQKRIASSIGISRQVAGYHLTKMEQEGVIEKEVVGRESRYYTSESSST
jgi:predicted transcriptional regulator